MGKKKIGAAIAGVLDTKTGKFYFGTNNLDGARSVFEHAIIRKNINRMPSQIKKIYAGKTKGAGLHAEVKVLNEALLARKDALPSDLMVYVINSKNRMPMPRCYH